MTGVGAIFELYTSYKESRRDLKVGKDEPKLEPDPEESVEGYYLKDEESEWHYVIESEAWDALLDLLQRYDFMVYKPKEPDKKKKQRLRVVGAAMWMKNKVLPPKPPDEQPMSPLLALNEHGQTPLHLAVKHLAPDKYVIRMVFCEKRAALIADAEGKLPLHWSCLCERNVPVIDRLIRANFHHMQREDNDGKTALCYAVMKATEHDDALGNPDFYWGIPRTKEEAEWQERREKIWSKCRFILLSYSTRRKVFVESERDLLLQTLEHAGPPGLVEVCILAAQGMLHSDPTLASTALRLFMKRQYPIKNLNLLLHHFPDENVESLEAARKLLTEHYHEGCRWQQGRKFTFREEMEKHALEENYKRSLPAQEWWNKIQCLLRLCAHQNSKEKKEIFENKYLLHAALTNSDTPPSLVQLLMVMKPEAIRLQHPYNHALLIHLICRNWKYNLYPHSKKIGIQTDSEEPPMEQVLKIMLASDATLTRKRHHDRLPLHDAISTSKSVEFLDALVQKDRQSLSFRDVQTRLYPFQMAAVNNLNKNAAMWAHARYAPDEWKNLEVEERAKAVDDVLEEQKVEQLNTIYYLLRANPAAVEPAATLRKAHGFRDTHGKGMVSAHYLLLLYARGDYDDFVLLKENLALIHESIKAGKVVADLEQWWSKLKFWIRYCYTGSLRLPHDDEYLLHAAVANSDVPPLVVELVLAIYPNSASLPVSGQQAEYPLHIAAATPQYAPQPFETIESGAVITLLFNAYPEAAEIQSPSGLPVDIARAKGTRSPEEIRVLRGVVSASFMIQEEDEIDLMGGDEFGDEDEDEFGEEDVDAPAEKPREIHGIVREIDDIIDLAIVEVEPVPASRTPFVEDEGSPVESQEEDKEDAEAKLLSEPTSEHKGQVLESSPKDTEEDLESDDALSIEHMKKFQVEQPNENKSASPPPPQAEKPPPEEDEKFVRTVVRLQSFARGSIARTRVSLIVDQLIAEMEAKLEEDDDDDDD